MGRKKLYNNPEELREHFRAYNKNYYIINKDKIKAQHKVYRENNIDKARMRDRAYSKANKDKFNNRYKTDIQYKLSKLLRNRLQKSLKNKWKSGSAIKDLGCTIDELKTHLESKFQLGMTWDNWGFEGWHIDHIKPLASFDLTDREQFLIACHYTNLQPLWAKDNMAKSDKIISCNV